MDMMESDYTYVGSELELFAGATRWKSYLADQVAPFLGEEVLEVGAGLGGTTRRLCRGVERRWVCLEPDEGLAGRLSGAIVSGELPACCRVEVGTLERLAREPAFDTLLYIDVMEHIEDDAGELARAASSSDPAGTSSSSRPRINGCTLRSTRPSGTIGATPNRPSGPSRRRASTSFACRISTRSA